VWPPMNMYLWLTCDTHRGRMAGRRPWLNDWARHIASGCPAKPRVGTECRLPVHHYTLCAAHADSVISDDRPVVESQRVGNTEEEGLGGNAQSPTGLRMIDAHRCVAISTPGANAGGGLAQSRHCPSNQVDPAGSRAHGYQFMAAMIQPPWRCSWPSSAPVADVASGVPDRRARDPERTGWWGFFVNNPGAAACIRAGDPAVAEMLSPQVR